MKKVIYRASILLPLALIYYTFAIEPVAIIIPEINVFLGYSSAIMTIVFLTIIWLCCSPFRKNCCNGTWTELLFNLVPIEMVLMAVFAQWHFYIALFVLIGFIIFEISLFMNLSRSAHRRKMTEKGYRRYKALFQRCSVLIAFLFFLIPCIRVFFYGMASPTYQAQKEIMAELFLDTDDSSSVIEINADPYQLNSDLWAHFEEKAWKRLSIDERICVIQQLADFESSIFGIPAIPVTARVLNAGELGGYSDDNHEMMVNAECLATSSVEEIVDTVCHEIFHSYQHFIVNNMDWTNPVADTIFFEEVRLWAENQKEYKNVYLYGFDAYQNQELEVTAREYAKEETMKILSYVPGN